MAKAFGAAIRNLRRATSVHRSRRPDAGARHRRHHRDVLGRGCRPHQPVAVPQCRSLRRSSDGRRLKGAARATTAAPPPSSRRCGARPSVHGRRGLPTSAPSTSRAAATRKSSRSPWSRRDCLPILGVTPALGRLFTEEDAATGHVVMIGHQLWSARFGSDPGIVGRDDHHRRRAASRHRRDAVDLPLSRRQCRDSGGR